MSSHSSQHFLPPLPSGNTNINSRKGQVSYRRLRNSSERQIPQGQSTLLDEYNLTSEQHDVVNTQETTPHNNVNNSNDENLGVNIADHEQKGLIQSHVEHSQVEMEWPFPYDDEAARKRNELERLPSTFEDTQRNLKITGNILTRIITWNQQAKPLPPVEELTNHLFTKGVYHIVAIGTQECENSISKSILNPVKEKWELCCSEILGSDYVLIRGHALQASHLAVYVHKAIQHLVNNVESRAVATGICNTLGNKGGIGITFSLGRSTFCFLTAHLAAHQDQLDRRTNEFATISQEVATMLKATSIDSQQGMKNSERESSSDKETLKTEDQCSDEVFVDDADDEDNHEERSKCNRFCCSNSCSSMKKYCLFCCEDEYKDRSNPLLSTFDYVFWAGDLNYRINATRDVVDSLLATNRYDILISNDQLSLLLQFEKTFAGFREGAITFRPSYKYDKGTDVYDTSTKRRVPSWTDRILYKSTPQVELISYFAAQEVRSSDHRPVYASFQCKIDCISDLDERSSNITLSSESRSEVCVIS